MEVTSIKRYGDWQRVIDAARMTAGKDSLGKEPSEEWKRKIIFAEHSPIRLLEYDIVIKDVPYYVMVHIVRHHEGIEKFVTTSREDRTGVDRTTRKQTDPVDMMLSINAQALINISRKRLCFKADPNTRAFWLAIVRAIDAVDPIVSAAMAPECIYRDLCPEMQSCGWAKTDDWAKAREAYKDEMFCAAESEKEEL